VNINSFCEGGIEFNNDQTPIFKRLF